MIIPESDWKKFKPLRDKALATLCDRILSEIAATSAEEALSSHEKYLKIYSQRGLRSNGTKTYAKNKDV
jgi:hypothetical protein